MPVDTRELMNALAILADQNNMRIAVKQSGKGAMICAASCFVGGMLLGPLGLAVGGSLGGIGAAIMTQGTFKPVSTVIREDLTVAQQELLVEKVLTAVRQIEPTDIALLLPLIMGSKAIQESVLRTVVSFVTNEMRLQVLD